MGSLINCSECKFAGICKVPEDKRDYCRADVKPDNLIFGYTPDQIARMQGIKKLKK